MKSTGIPSRVLAVMLLLVAVCLLATGFSVHQVRADDVEIIFDQAGVGSGFVGTVVNIDDSDYALGDLPKSFQWQTDSVHSFSFASPLNVGGGVQYTWGNTTGLSNVQSGSLTVVEAGTVAGNYKTQCYLTVTSAEDSPNPTSGWFDYGTQMTASVTSPTPGPAGTRYVCTGWTGTGSVPASGSEASVSFTVAEASSIVWSWSTQYYLTVTSAYGSPSPVSGWFDIGTNVTASVTSPVADGSDTQHVCLGWTGTGSVPVSGSGLSTTFAMTMPSSIVWNWKTQYFLTVVSEYGSPSPVSGWFDSGSGVTASVTSPIDGGPDTRYVCTGWTGTGSVPASGSEASVSFTVAEASSIVWSWSTQYYLTVTSAYGSPSPVSGWFNAGADVTASVVSPVAGGPETRYVCTGWTGSGSVPGSGGGSSTTFAVTMRSSIVWNWKTQYQVTFDQIGVGTDFTGTVVNVDGHDYLIYDLPLVSWWDSGSSLSFSFDTPLIVGTKQYAWGSTSGLSTLNSDTLTVTSGGSVIGGYTVQNQVSFVQVGVTSDFTDTIVTIDSVGYTRAQLPISFSWTIGSVHSFSFHSPLRVGGNAKQYLWTSTTGMSYLRSGSITVTAYGSIVGTYKTQYYLYVTSQYGSPFPLRSWFDSGTQITASVTSPIPDSAGTQYACTGWTGTGSVPASGTDTSVSFTITQVSGITWRWNTQYYLTVTSSNGQPDPVSGWFDGGSPVTASVDSPIPIGAGTQYSCTGWSGIGSVPSSGTSTITVFTINSPSSITWNWITECRLIMSTNYGTTSPSGTTWHAIGTSLTISASPPSAATGERYVLEGWTGSGTGSYTGSTASPTIEINGPMNETASWTRQYLLTVNSPYGSPTPSSEWFNDGTQVQATLSGSPAAGPARTRYVCTGWSGSGSVPTSGSIFYVSFTMSAPSSVTWNWKAQYQLTVSSAYSSATGEGWHDSGSATYAILAEGVVSDSPSMRHVFVGWSGDASGSDLRSSLIVMNAPKTATAEWKTQYYLNVTSDYSTAGGSGWYDSGSAAYASLENGTAYDVGDVRHVFTGWSGDASGIVYSQSDEIVMDRSKTAVATWTAARYALTILAPHDSIDGFTSPNAGVYAMNESLPVTVTATCNAGYTFEYWVLDGENITGNPVSLSMTVDHTLQPVFRILNFTLTLLPSDMGTTAPAAGTYSYNYGSNITVSASPNEAYQFDHWQLSGSNVSLNPITVMINGDQTLQPFFQLVPSVPAPPLLHPALVQDLIVFAIIGLITATVFSVYVMIERRR